MKIKLEDKKKQAIERINKMPEKEMNMVTVFIAGMDAVKETHQPKQPA